MQTLIEWFPAVATSIYLALFIGRSLHLGLRHHVRVFTLFAAGKRRLETARELLFVVAFPAWVYLVVASAPPLGLPTLPSNVDPVLADSSLLEVLGVGAMGGAIAVFTWSLISFGRSWRVGIDKSGSGGLITVGAFGWSRNPIFLSLDLLAVGAFLLSGQLVLLVFALGIGVGLHLQILGEERFLAVAHGAAYRSYCASVGRYFGRTPNRKHVATV